MQSEQIVTEELKALPDNDEDYEKIESAIRKLFREEIYLPIIKLLGVDKRVIINASNDLLEGIRTGRIQFYRGSFSGRFTAGISKELRALGAKWERTTGTFKLPQSSLSFEVRSAISASQSTFQQRLDAIDRKLAQIVPEEIADRMSLTKHFDTTLWKVDRDIRKAVSKITVQAQLSEEQREKLAAEWNDNIKLEIKDWTQKKL
ncbi:unnamed protein product [Sphagnum jensenii]|uniref:Uncharacterized protein n=1 Tax=Sphagnum jensenii TaxID=128206 RepID=A0ABP0V962_9BRYO